MDPYIFSNGFTNKNIFKVFSTDCICEYSQYRGVGKDESFYFYKSRYYKVHYKNEIISEEKMPMLSIFLPQKISEYNHSFAYAKSDGYAQEVINYDERISSTISKELGFKFLKSNFFKNLNEELKTRVFEVLTDLHERNEGYNSRYKTLAEYIEKLNKQNYLGGTYHESSLTEEALILYPEINFEIIDVNNLELLNATLEFIKRFAQVNPNTIIENLKEGKTLIAKDSNNNIIATTTIKPIKNRAAYIDTILNKSKFTEETIKNYTFKRDNSFNGELGYCNVIDNYRGIGIMDYMIKYLAKDKVFATTGNPAMATILARSGFCKVGKEWEGKYNLLLSLYIYDPNYNKKILFDKTVK